ncbi:MAG: hypothetical protein H7A25_04090 [Leptospiraceae bacterium]|nr:hypothetical protein [Leptospiraceae bacterium]
METAGEFYKKPVYNQKILHMKILYYTGEMIAWLEAQERGEEYPLPRLPRLPRTPGRKRFSQDEFLPFPEIHL